MTRIDRLYFKKTSPPGSILDSRASPKSSPGFKSFPSRGFSGKGSVPDASGKVFDNDDKISRVHSEQSKDKDAQSASACGSRAHSSPGNKRKNPKNAQNKKRRLQENLSEDDASAGDRETTECKCKRTLNENWVGCDGCDGWFHLSCAGFT